MCGSARGLIGIGWQRHPVEEPIIQPRHVLIAGATATGKSALAMQRAAEIGGVIVNADSQQLYADLRILTARPSVEDEAALPHCLYGVADASEAWSAGRWLNAVELLLKAETRPLVIVGGTGLYFHALLKGLAPVPAISPDVRDRIDAAFENHGETEVRKALAQVDPLAERRITPGDRQRLVRALSVSESTGRSLSSWQAETTPPLLNLDMCEAWVVERPREALYARCDARVDAMIAAGAIAEVESLLARRLRPDLPAMLAVGVREIAAAIAGEMDLETAVQTLKTHTRQYAKRQLTWFRNQMPDWTRRNLAEL
ncbi:tRNA (adenosine(37)-N6)-dimethylallyltransferase MiaA [Brevundimonas aveniformis]|uniref:tRNA (adenosine(37)-N6)-dimethylallyltransferase MiaA n=1 Tax=Brevundimonas aveniformis TaxID=370977 RepID=UPI0031E5DFD9